MKKTKFIFQWKLGGLQVEHTWAYSSDEAWERAVAICRPADMKRAAVRKVMDYLKEHGEVVELET